MGKSETYRYMAHLDFAKPYIQIIHPKLMRQLTQDNNGFEKYAEVEL